MSTLWEVPVATPEDFALALSRRVLRETVVQPVPRDPRPSRARHERMPAQLRVWGAASRKIGLPPA